MSQLRGVAQRLRDADSAPHFHGDVAHSHDLGGCHHTHDPVRGVVLLRATARERARIALNFVTLACLVGMALVVLVMVFGYRGFGPAPETEPAPTPTASSVRV